MKAILIVIKDYMEASGITAKQLANNCGISEPYDFCHFERLISSECCRLWLHL